MEAICADLFEAAEMGNTGVLDRIPYPGVLATRNPQGDTACHVALRQGRLEFASRIAALHPPVLYTPNAAGDTVLHCAIRLGRLELFAECVQYLRSYLGETINKDDDGRWSGGEYRATEAYNCSCAVTNGEGKSLLYMAAENGYAEVVRILLGAPLLRKSAGPGPNGSALHVAVWEKKYGNDVIEALLQYRQLCPSERDGNGDTPLHVAVMLNDPKTVELLLKCSNYSAIDWNKDGISPCHLAATTDNYLEVFKLFVQIRPDICRQPTRAGQNVLHLAVKGKAAAIVDSITKDRKLSEPMMYQQDSDGNTPLDIDVSNGVDKMLNTVLASQAAYEALFDAAKTGNTQFLDQFSYPEALIAVRIPQRDTACHVALQQGHLEFALKIAELHPPVLYKPNAAGDTVLHCAIQLKQVEFFAECVKCLRKYFGETINKEDDGRWSASEYRATEAYNCSCAVTNREGKSLIYMAAENGYAEVVRILLGAPLLRKWRIASVCISGVCWLQQPYLVGISTPQVGRTARSSISCKQVMG